MCRLFYYVTLCFKYVWYEWNYVLSIMAFASICVSINYTIKLYQIATL